MTGWGTGYSTAVIDGVSIFDSKITAALDSNSSKTTKQVAEALSIEITETALQNLGETLARLSREAETRKPRWSAWR